MTDQRDQTGTATQQIHILPQPTSPPHPFPQRLPQNRWCQHPQPRLNSQLTLLCLHPHLNLLPRQRLYRRKQRSVALGEDISASRSISLRPLLNLAAARSLPSTGFWAMEKSSHPCQILTYPRSINRAGDYEVSVIVTDGNGLSS